MRRTLFVFKKLFPGGGSTIPIRSVSTPILGDGAAGSTIPIRSVSTAILGDGAAGSTIPIRSVSTPISGDGDGPNLTNLFDNWCKDRGKVYASEEEKQRRLKVFERNYDTIIKFGNPVKLHRYGFLDVEDQRVFCVDLFDEKKYASKQMIHCNCIHEWNEVLRRLYSGKLKLVVVEFGLSWRAPILSKTAKETPNVLFLKLDCDDDMGGIQRVAQHYKIEVFPSIVFFKEGGVIERIETTEEEAVAAKITQLHDHHNPVSV